MLRDITIGQYYPAQSPIHRLDPRVKLAGTMLYILSLFIGQGPLSYALSLLFLITVIYRSQVPYRFITKGLKGIIMIMIISASFNLFLTKGTPVLDIPYLRIVTYEGLQKTAVICIRLVMLVIGTSMMTLTTTPNALTDGLEKGLGFLKKWKVPVHEIAMMMSIALRFIPILIEETDKIMKAQIARGADLESGGIIKRAKAMVPILVPLFVSAFRRAADLAMAMEARCYHGGENRTRMKPLIYTPKDKKAYRILILYLAAVIALRFAWTGLTRLI